jgi:D-arabinose 1-dehydrogenase-like Zn-dependent alcohol dehydrogenase
VLVIEPGDERRELAGRLGARTVDPGQADDVIAAAASFSRGIGVDGVVVTAATTDNGPVRQAAQICRKRGRIVLVGVTGLGIFLGDNDSSTDRLVEHVCHYADLVGPEHVGIGLDHVHVAFDLAEEVSGRPDYWPPGQQYDTPGITCAHPSQARGIC